MMKRIIDIVFLLVIFLPATVHSEILSDPVCLAPDTLVLKPNRVMMVDSLSLQLNGFSHKRPYQNGPTKATAYITCSKGGVKDTIELSVHGNLSWPAYREYNTVVWQGYVVSLLLQGCDDSVIISVRKHLEENE